MLTLNDWYCSYQDLVNEGLTSNAVQAYRRAWVHRLASTLGHLDLADLTPLVIARARTQWDGASSTKADAAALLSRLLQLAVMDGRITANPCRSLPRSRQKAVDADPVARSLTDAEVTTMLDLTAGTPHGQRALAGLAFTGLRLGELVGLRWDDVDEDRGLLTIRRTYSPDGHGRLRERPTKTGRVRHVPILDRLTPWLDAAREQGYEHVFTGQRGGPFDSGNLARATRWVSIRDRIKTFPPGEPPLRHHDLRHTYLSTLVRAGATPEAVQRVAGHASIQTTELYTRTGSTAAALEVKALMDGLSREVAKSGGGEAGKDRVIRSSGR